MRSVVIIPARFTSTRLPGKPLLDICGKPMVWWVYHNVLSSKKANEICIATDDQKIFDVCKNYKMNVIMTKTTHPTAIHRLHEVAQYYDADLYIQINGDEPLLKAKNIDSFLKWSSSLSPSILKKPCGINAISKIDSPVELMDVANIKMTFDSEYRCTYMSRAPIPFPYKSLNCTYYKHIGIIGYTRKMLDFFVSSVPGYFEKIEGIDLLRFVDYGKPLYLHEIKECCSLSVDTEKDLEEVRIRIGKN